MGKKNKKDSFELKAEKITFKKKITKIMAMEMAINQTIII